MEKFNLLIMIQASNIQLTIRFQALELITILLIHLQTWNKLKESLVINLIWLPEEKEQLVLIILIIIQWTTKFLTSELIKILLTHKIIWNRLKRNLVNGKYLSKLTVILEFGLKKTKNQESHCFLQEMLKQLLQKRK